MAHMLVRHTVENYARWKPVFDQQAGTREEAGSKGGFIFRNAEDPNDIFILLEWESLESARKFFQSPSVGEVMEEAGVAGEPEVWYLDSSGQPPV